MCSTRLVQAKPSCAAGVGQHPNSSVPADDSESGSTARDDNVSACSRSEPPRHLRLPPERRFPRGSTAARGSTAQDDNVSACSRSEPPRHLRPRLPERCFPPDSTASRGSTAAPGKSARPCSNARPCSTSFPHCRWSTCSSAERDDRDRSCPRSCHRPVWARPPRPKHWPRNPQRPPAGLRLTPPAGAETRLLQKSTIASSSTSLPFSAETEKPF